MCICLFCLCVSRTGFHLSVHMSREVHVYLYFCACCASNVPVSLCIVSIGILYISVKAVYFCKRCVSVCIF